MNVQILIYITAVIHIDNSIISDTNIYGTAVA